MFGQATRERKTIWALFLSNILSEPLLTVYGFSALILRKNLDGTAFQIALLTMLKPLVAILSFYWSSHFSKKLRMNFLGASFFSRIPFLFFPFIDSSSYFIFAVALYTLFSRAGMPAWMEILKINLQKEKREKIFSWGFTLSYVEGMLLAVGVGSLLDSYEGAWKMLFFLSALIGLLSLFHLSKIPVDENQEEEIKEPWKQTLARPWKKAFHLMRTRPDFAHFQWGFMFCGFGIMLSQPAIPLFFADTLKISYMEFGIANTICKGVCIALSSPFWSRLMSRYSFFSLSSFVFVLVGLQPLFLLLAPFHFLWVYIAYIFYGIAQGGSHLIWHLSGPHFAKEEDSSGYTGMNVMMVGVRGAVAPLLGGGLCVMLGALPTLFLSGALCLYSGYFMLKRKEIGQEA